MRLQFVNMVKNLGDGCRGCSCGDCTFGNQYVQDRSETSIVFRTPSETPRTKKHLTIKKSNLEQKIKTSVHQSKSAIKQIQKAKAVPLAEDFPKFEVVIYSSESANQSKDPTRRTKKIAKVAQLTQRAMNSDRHSSSISRQKQDISSISSTGKTSPRVLKKVIRASITSPISTPEPENQIMDGEWVPIRVPSKTFPRIQTSRQSKTTNKMPNSAFNSVKFTRPTTTPALNSDSDSDYDPKLRVSSKRKLFKQQEQNIPEVSWKRQRLTLRKGSLKSHTPSQTLPSISQVNPSSPSLFSQFMYEQANQSAIQPKTLREVTSKSMNLVKKTPKSAPVRKASLSLDRVTPKATPKMSTPMMTTEFECCQDHFDFFFDTIGISI